MRKSKIGKHHRMTNSVAQTVIFLKMQKKSCGVNQILIGKFFFVYQRKCSKFSFDFIFHRILMKFEPDAHLNIVYQSPPKE